MLQLEALFPGRECAIADGEQLLFIEMELALVVYGPFEFAGHAEGIHGTGVDAESAEQTARRVHIVFFGIPFGRFSAGYFAADDPDHTREGRPLRRDHIPRISPFRRHTATAPASPVVVRQQALSCGYCSVMGL